MVVHVFRSSAVTVLMRMLVIRVHDCRRAVRVVVIVQERTADRREQITAQHQAGKDGSCLHEHESLSHEHIIGADRVAVQSTTGIRRQLSLCSLTAVAITLQV